MTSLNVTEARSKLYSLIDETAETHKPIVITGKRHNAVLLAESDWNAINEALYTYCRLAWANPYARVWEQYWKIASKNLIGNVAALLYQTSRKGCEKTSRIRA
jgi:PHD/YefM family antitoxin component YafN of YafNO toxin-antitoxin module